MGFRNPVTSAVDQTARDAASAAQSSASAANSAASTANAAASAASTAAAGAQTAADAAYTEATTGVVAGSRLAAESVTAGKLAAGAVTTAKLTAGAVTANELAAGSITSAKLTTGAVTAAAVAAGAIDGMTVTGATVRTAASGARTELDTAHGLRFYSGIANETLPGTVYASGAQGDTNGEHVLIVDSGGSGGRLVMGYQSAAAGGYESTALLSATNIKVSSGVRMQVNGDPVTAAYSPGWTGQTAAPTYDVNLFQRTVEGWVNVYVCGLYAGGAGASAKVLALSGKYVPTAPIAGKTQVLNGSVNDLARSFDVRPDGIYLRGALPTAGQFFTIAGTYFVGTT